jgi:hypothetical protein
MIEGTCPKCSQRYYGWVLLQPRSQNCSKCGIGLLITEDGKNIIPEYASFNGDDYKFKSHYKPTLDPERINDTSKKE